MKMLVSEAFASKRLSDADGVVLELVRLLSRGFRREGVENEGVSAAEVTADA